MDQLIGLIPDNILYIVGALCLGWWIKDGIVHPLFNRGNGKFAAESASTDPKAQYAALAIASFVFGTAGHVGSWLATGRVWIMDGFSRGSEWAFGFSAAWLALVILILIWIDLIVPGGREPNGRPGQHFLMWIVSFMLFPMLATVNPTISSTVFAFAFVGIWVFNKKYRSGGGSRSGAMAGAGAGRSF